MYREEPTGDGLFQKYYRWGVRTAIRIAKYKAIPEADLPIYINSGLIALWDCSKRYDPSRCGFSTYASKRIAGAVLDTMREMDPLPRSIRRECAEKGTAAPVIFDITEGRMGEDGSELGIGDREDEVAGTGLDRAEDAELVRSLLSCLDDDDREMVVAIVSGDMTACEYARGVGLHETRISQRMSGAMRVLRRAARRLGFAEEVR